MIPFGIHFIQINQTQPEPLRAAHAERVSLRASLSLRASMTVEASLVLPLFLFFMAEVLSVFDMIRLQSRFVQALNETGTRMSAYAFYTEYVSDNEAEPVSMAGEKSLQGEEKDGSGTSVFTGYAASLVMTETYVRSRVEDYMGEDYLNSTCLEGGASSVSYLRSQIMSGNDVIDLVADFRVKPVLPLFGLRGFPLQCRYYGHAWTGYRIGSGEEKEDDSGEETVFITTNGSVYHRSISCTYLKPRTKTIAARSLTGVRSADGSIYYPCENCRPAAVGNVVITSYGNRYHRSSSCSSIHRDVTEVPLSAVKDTMRACSKCGGENR